MIKNTQKIRKKINSMKMKNIRRNMSKMKNKIMKNKIMKKIKKLSQ